MEYTQEKNDGDITVSLQEQFTFSDIQPFQELVSNIIAQAPKQVVLNVSALAYIDSAALGALLLLRDKTEKEGISVVLKGAKDQVKKALDIACFDQLFEIR